MTTIKGLFASDITRTIEEVTKVDQSDAEVIKAEIEEYVATQSIQDNLNAFLDLYASTPNKPHEGIAAGSPAFSAPASPALRNCWGLPSRTVTLLASARPGASATSSPTGASRPT